MTWCIRTRGQRVENSQKTGLPETWLVSGGEAGARQGPGDDSVSASRIRVLGGVRQAPEQPPRCCEPQAERTQDPERHAVHP